MHLHRATAARAGETSREEGREELRPSGEQETRLLHRRHQHAHGRRGFPDRCLRPEPF